MPAGCLIGDIVPQRSWKAKLIVVPAARAVSREQARTLLDSMRQGAWVIWERAAGFCSEDSGATSDGSGLLCDALGIRIQRCIRAVSKLYVQYRWPTVAMVRAFHQVASLDCSRDEIAAEYDGAPVAIRRAFGKGGLVFLGSMLGPGIRAGDPQARQVAQRWLGMSDFQEDFSAIHPEEHQPIGE